MDLAQPSLLPARLQAAHPLRRGTYIGAASSGQGAHRLAAFDMFLIVMFLIGLYTSFTIPITKTIPFPSAPAGIAGLLMLWRRRHQIDRHGVMGLAAVVTVFSFSILVAPNLTFLPRRLNGLIQVIYSVMIAYALFLTLREGSRRQVARLFLGLALVLVVGCLLETYGGLRPVSDAVRRVLYNRGLYEADLRDLLYYNRIRPKFFASEPASVTFSYTLFSFMWLVTSRYRFKLAGYLVLMGAGMTAMPGPTLLLMLVLLIPYFLFLVARRNGRLSAGRFLPLMLIAALSAAAVWVVAAVAFPQRQFDARMGDDASTFYRVRGPALAGVDILSNFPLTGGGLTGEPFLEERITNLYVRSPYYSAAWPIVTPSTELLINFFWLHWIYLGAVLGSLMVGLVGLWLYGLGVPSPMFCAVVWAIFGQAAGAYVGPACWSVLFMAAAAAVLNQRGTSPDPGAGTAS